MSDHTNNNNNNNNNDNNSNTEYQSGNGVQSKKKKKKSIIKSDLPKPPRNVGITSENYKLLEGDLRNLVELDKRLLEAGNLPQVLG